MSVWQMIEDNNKQLAEQAAFGHLAPEKNKSYKGIIRFSSGGVNDGLLDYEFEGLQSSPWLHSYLKKLIADWIVPIDGIWEIRGTFRNYYMSGTPKLVLAGISTNEIKEYVGKQLINRKRGADSLFNGYEVVTEYSIELNGKPKRISKTNVTVKIYERFSQKTYDLARKIHLAKQ